MCERRLDRWITLNRYTESLVDRKVTLKRVACYCVSKHSLVINALSFKSFYLCDVNSCLLWLAPLMRMTSEFYAWYVNRLIIRQRSTLSELQRYEQTTSVRQLPRLSLK